MHNMCPVCKHDWVNYKNMVRTKDNQLVCSIACKERYENWLDNDKVVTCVQNHLATRLTKGKQYQVLEVKKDRDGEMAYLVKDDYDFISRYTHFWFSNPI